MKKHQGTLGLGLLMRTLLGLSICALVGAGCAGAPQTEPAR